MIFASGRTFTITGSFQGFVWRVLGPFLALFGVLTGLFVFIPAESLLFGKK